MTYAWLFWPAIGVFVLTHVFGVGATKVYYVSPRVGSLNGETRITIRGIDFAANQFNFGKGNEHLGNRVTLVSKTGAYTCRIHPDGTTATQIVCITPPLPPGVYDVHVYVDGEKIPDDDHCPSNKKLCQFSPVSWRTPLIRKIEPVYGEPGSIMTLNGTQYTNFFGPNEAGSTNGKSVRLIRVYVNGQTCEVKNTSSVDEKFYGLFLNNNGLSNEGTIRCKMAGSFVGNQNVSYILNEDYGRSLAVLNLKRVTAQNTIAMIQTYAVVESVSPVSGSNAGGTLITIGGKYFDETNAKVTVGGVVCEVKTVTDDTITCLTATKPDNVSLAGSRGVGMESWDASGGEPADLDAVTADSSTSLADFSWADTSVPKYVTRTAGFFIPPTDSDYQLRLIANAEAVVYLSTSESPADKKSIIDCTGQKTVKFHQNKCQYSERIALEASKKYYIEMVHKVTASGVGGSFLLGAHMYNTVYTHAQSDMARNERQLIKSTSTPQAEIQTLRFSNWTVADDADVVSEVQAVTITSDSVGDAIFRLGMYGVFTGPMKGSVLEEVVMTELNSLPSIYPEEVSVVKTQTNGSVTFTVTFNSKRGDWADLEVVKDTQSPVELTGAVVEETRGIPARDHLYLSFGGVPSSKIPLDPSAVDVKTALRALFSVRCPRHMTHPRSAKHKQDYEAVTADRETEPFCGTASAKNWPVLYARTYGDGGIELYYNPQLCFAYRGVLKNSLRLIYNGSDNVVRQEYFDVPFEAKPKWQYRCIDLLSLIKTTRRDMVRARLLYAALVQLSPEVDFYVDNVYIGSKPPTTDSADFADRRRLKTAEWYGEPVDVTRSDDGLFTVTISPIGCLHNLSLLAVLHATASGVESVLSYADEAWPAQMKVDVARVAAAAPPISGTFSLQDGSTTIDNLGADVTGEELRRRLETAVGAGAVKVTRGGSCSGYTWVVEWMSTPGDRALMTVTHVLTSGFDAKMTLTTIEDGGVIFAPIPGDMLRTSHDLPQVAVTINGIPSLCSGACDFEWSDTATPTIASVTPESGSQVDGTTITIVGTGFSDELTNVSVVIGGTACVVQSASVTQIECAVGTGPAGGHVVMVTVSDKGVAQQPDTPVEFTYNFNVASIAPSAGGLAGGINLTLNGSGFSSSVSVQVGSNPCEVVSVDYASIICTVPSATAAATVDVIASQGTVTSSALQFTYDASLTAVVTSLSSTTGLIEGGTSVTISGTSFGDNASGLNRVTLGGRAAEIGSYTDTSVVVTLPALPPGLYPIQLFIAGSGLADVSSVNQIEYKLKVTGVSPQHGSMQGGTLVTLTGNGFSVNVDSVVVTLGDTECAVISSTATAVVCKTGNPSVVHDVDNTGIHPEFGRLYAWSVRVLTIAEGDYVRWQWNTPMDIEGPGYRVEQVATATSLEYLEDGFLSAPLNSQNGAYQYQFPIIGEYHYWSGAGDIVMRGIVKVESRSSFTVNVTLEVAGFEAEYATPVAETGAASDDCDDGTTSAVPDCSELITPDPSATRPYFTFWRCATPAVTAVSVTQGVAGTAVTVTGSGFGADCQTLVDVGGYECEVTGSAAGSVTCAVGVGSGLKVGVAHPFTVFVLNRGNALLKIADPVGRRFVLLPSVTSVTPAQGSLAGGTTLTIAGDGFEDGATTVTVTGGVECAVTQVKASQILCVTSASVAASGAVAVRVGALPPAKCPGACGYEFTGDATPTVANVTPTAVTAPGVALTLTGVHFGSDVVAVTVTVGGVVCKVTSVSDTEVVCEESLAPAGSHVVAVQVAGVGASPPTVTLFITPTVTAVSPDSGSIGGGTKVTIAGFGFNSDNVTVSVGGATCEVESASLTTVVCVTAPAGAAASQPVEVTSAGDTFPVVQFAFTADKTPTVTSVTPDAGTASDVLTVAGTGFGSVISDVSVLLDDVVCDVTAVTDTEVVCAAGVHAAGVTAVSVLVSPNGFSTGSAQFTYELSVSAIAPIEGSFGGGQTVVIDGYGFSADASQVTICDDSCVIVTAADDKITCTSPTVTDPGSGTLECTVVVTVGSVTESPTSKYTYKATLTSEVTSVTPARGGTAGGTLITIAGTGFGEVKGKVGVSVAGVACEVVGVTDTEVTCRTGEHPKAVKAVVKVVIGSSGEAKTSSEFEYINVWSSPFTWGGTVPGDGDLVVITEDMAVTLDTKTARMALLLIKGGKLIFDRESDDVELHAERILITAGGLLEVGTEEAPFLRKATIMLHGHVRSKELPIYGTKMLALREGSIELHGRPVNVTWTRLAATAQAESTTLVLQEPVDWLVGDVIIVATTGGRHSQRENEECTISTVSDDKLTLTLEKGLTYKHLGETVPLSDTHSLEARAEVGLLTHNVVFRGSDDPVWHDKIEACPEGFDTGEFATQTCFQGRFGEQLGSDQFGAHIMVHPAEKSSGLVQLHISDVELTYVGQAFRMGRYPVHFHINGDMGGSYVRRCSIHQSFNRAVNVHATNRVLVERNVAYNIMGGAFFLEDGIEVKNVFIANLAVFVVASTSLQNDDITPAAFWVTNADNEFRDNAAAGGSHFGFWFRMHARPDGPSYDPRYCPQKTPLGVFANNTAHSLGWFGIWFFQSYFPMESGACSASTPTPARFQRLTAWNCEKGAEWVNGGAIQLVDFLLVNNEVAGIEMKSIANAPLYSVDGARLQGGVIAAAPLNSGTLHPQPTRSAIILPYSRGLVIDGMTFLNFNEAGRSVFGVTTIQGKTEARNGGFTYHTAALTFTSSPNVFAFRWEHEAVLLDTDGSLCGTTGCKVVAHSLTLPPTLCRTDPRFSVNAGVPGSYCDPEVTFHRFAFHHALPQSLVYKGVKMENQHGATLMPYKKKRVTHPKGWMAILVSGETYRMSFVDAEQLTNISYTGVVYDFPRESDHVIIEHNFTQRADRFQVTPGQMRNASVTALSAATNINGDWFVKDEPEGGVLFSYIVNGRDAPLVGGVAAMTDAGTPTDRPIDLDVHTCFYANCVVPSGATSAVETGPRPADFIRWGDAESWKEAEEGFGGNYGNGEYGVPREDDDVRIRAGTWVVVDTPLPRLGKLYVDGVLEFEHGPVGGAVFSFTLSCTHILIRGGRLIVGWPDAPFPGSAEILLRGNHLTPAMFLPGGPNIGAKAMGVFGGLDLHGVQSTVSWTRLAASATSGTTSLVLSEPVDWSAGDELVVAPTGFSAWQTETVTIATVAADKVTITLTEALKYDHIAVTELLAGGRRFTMAAEVGLLTKNIKIVGEDYGDLQSEAFGARVLVGTYYDDVTDTEMTGFARVENVEFFHTGQEGWVALYDPRYSLVFLSLGEDPVSYVRRCSFHHGFASAIGVLDTHQMEVSHNVIHHTVGSAVMIRGSENRVEGNLVTLVVFPGTYNGRLEARFEWQAAFEILSSPDTVLRDNAAAGSERAGYRVDGVKCSTAADGAWRGNTAHSVLIGVVSLPEDGLTGCSAVVGFYVWRAWDYGVYIQVKSSIVVRDVTSMENSVGLLAMVIGPSSTSHDLADRTVLVHHATFIGASHARNCEDAMTNEDANVRLSKNGRSWRTESGGNIAVSWPTFESGSNGAPEKPFNGIMSYNAINGLMMVEDVTFAKFATSCTDRQDIVFTTNPNNDDAQHPIKVQRVALIDVAEHNKVFIHRPNIGKINPADCVDMDCDALKKALLRDEDGSFLNAPGDPARPGAVISQSEFEWDENPVRGLGDYRIPTVAQTDVNGRRLPVSDFAPHKGIIRDASCTLWPPSNGYLCHSLDYEMLMLESMDADTETRRVSPVAVIADGFVDLINGPQDHGWCSGYTCQKRLSLFPLILATGKEYKVYFTGTTPQSLRFHLLNAPATRAVVLCVWYAQSWRLEVYKDGRYMLPSNGRFNRAGQLVLDAPTMPGQFMPSAVTALGGENYFERATQMLCVAVRGSQPILVRTSALIIVTFGVTAMTVDEFFGERIVANLAAFLDIPPGQIRVSVATSETATRRRRRDVVIIVVVEIGAAAPGSGTPNDPSTPLNVDQLLVVSSKMSDAYQTGTLSTELHLEVVSMTMQTPPPAAGSAGWTALMASGGGATDTTVTVTVVRAMVVKRMPGRSEEGQAFRDQPLIAFHDAQGHQNPSVGTVGHRWHVRASLVTSAGAAADQHLRGSPDVTVLGGVARFSDLGVARRGHYRLRFRVTGQAVEFSAETAVFYVGVASRVARVVSQPRNVTSGATFTTTLQIYDGLTNRAANSSSGQAAVWTCTASVYAPSSARDALRGVTTSDSNPFSGTVEFHHLQLTSAGAFHLRFVCASTAYRDLRFAVISKVIEVDAGVDVTDTEMKRKRIGMKFDVAYTMIAGKESYFTVTLKHDLSARYPNARFSAFKAFEGSIRVDFDVEGSSEVVQSTVVKLHADLGASRIQITVENVNFTATAAMWVDYEEYSGPKEGAGKKRMSTGLIIGIVVGCLCGIVVIAAVALCCVCLCSKQKRNTGLKNAGYEDAYHSQSASPASYGSSSVSVNKLEFGYNDATMKPPPAPLCIMPREFHTPPPERPPSATSKWSESSGPPGYQRKHSASATLPMLG